MKNIFTGFVMFFSLFIIGCGNNTKQETLAPIQNKEDTINNYFPVTNYIKGQIFGIKNGNVTPFKKTIINGKVVDSAWLKMEGIDSNFTAFTSPIIDSANCKTTFRETKFKDETVGAFTFTYEPRTSKSDFAFTNWIVYVDAEKQQVSKVYLVKKITGNIKQQLTWNSDSNCKIVDVDIANSKVLKEVSISWDY
jgi:hypothetical protein